MDVVSGKIPRLAATQTCLSVQAEGERQKRVLALCTLLYALRNHSQLMSTYGTQSHRYMFGSLGPNMPFQPSTTSHSTNQPGLLKSERNHTISRATYVTHTTWTHT